MSTTDAPEQGPEPDRTEAVPTIACDQCGKIIAETATDVVPRRYMTLVVDERWCFVCIGAKDKNTEQVLRALSDDNEPDY